MSGEAWVSSDWGEWRRCDTPVPGICARDGDGTGRGSGPRLVKASEAWSRWTGSRRMCRCVAWPEPPQTQVEAGSGGLARGQPVPAPPTSPCSGSTMVKARTQENPHWRQAVVCAVPGCGYAPLTDSDCNNASERTHTHTHAHTHPSSSVVRTVSSRRGSPTHRRRERRERRCCHGGGEAAAVAGSDQVGQPTCFTNRPLTDSPTRQRLRSVQAGGAGQRRRLAASQDGDARGGDAEGGPQG